jgi:DNA replication protein DnaC
MSNPRQPLRADPGVGAAPKCILASDQRINVIPKGGVAVAHRLVPVDVQSCALCEGQSNEIYYDERGYRFVRPCSGLDLDRRIERFNRANLPARYCDANIESIDCNHHEQIAAIVELVQDYLERFKPGDNGFVFMGEVGCGKTHLMVACLRYLTLDLGISCRFVEFSHLLGELRDLYNQNRSEAELLAPLIKVPVLAIDELGKGRGSEFEQRIIDELISRRYNESGITTFFTTNYYPGEGGSTPPHAVPDGKPIYRVRQELAGRIGERVASRIFEMCDFINMPNVDYRQFLFSQRRRP